MAHAAATASVYEDCAALERDFRNECMSSMFPALLRDSKAEKHMITRRKIGRSKVLVNSLKVEVDLKLKQLPYSTMTNQLSI